MPKNISKYLFTLCSFFLISSCGKVEGDGAGSDGVDAGDHRIFVTSSSYNGNLGGLSGADDKCASAASGAGLIRSYKAVLSDSSNDAEDRLSITGEVYALNSSDESDLIAVSGTKFWGTDSTDLLNAIGYDENGNPVSNYAWSGTGSDGGVISGDHCNNWASSSSGVTGSLGDTTQVDDKWIEDTFNNACNQTYRIYCISQ